MGRVSHPHRLRRGRLAEQREARLVEVKNAYMATLELLAFHIESTEKNQQGHGNRVSELAVAIARELKLPNEDIENLRVAALLHEVGTRDQRLVRLLSGSQGDASIRSLARCMAPRGSSENTGTTTKSSARTGTSIRCPCRSP